MTNNIDIGSLYCNAVV